MFVVEVKSKGKCITRNGEFRIGAVKLELLKDGTVRMGFVSDRLRRDLHAGTTIDAKAMDELALEWVRRRGLFGRQIMASTTAMIALEDAAKAIDKLKGELGG